MKVRELIEALEKCEPDAQVFLCTSNPLGNEVMAVVTYPSCVFVSNE